MAFLFSSLLIARDSKRRRAPYGTRTNCFGRRAREAGMSLMAAVMAIVFRFGFDTSGAIVR